MDTIGLEEKVRVNKVLDPPKKQEQVELTQTNLERVKEIKNYVLWAEQIIYWRTHLDVFIEDYLGIKLRDTQKVVARAIGNATVINAVKSRGYGKTWLIAICAVALAILYPQCPIAVVSGTAKQAVLIVKKIQDFFVSNENVLREIKWTGKNPVYISNDKGICRFHNGSAIESYAIASMRGNRAKIVISDESPEIKEEEWNAVVRPVRNTTRSVCYKAEIKDFDSKTISITSACLKSNYFYSSFMTSLERMARGDTKHFSCALDYKSSIRSKTTMSGEEFFEEERNSMPETIFAMEYGSFFMGEEENSFFPYDLTNQCKTVKTIEYAMPKNSKYRYVIGVDIAGSGSKTADNSVLTVIKMIEKPDGTIVKHVVYIRSYRGIKITRLADEVRKLYARFPNVIKVVVDTNGIGFTFPEFFAEPWIDPLTGREYPAWNTDDNTTYIHNSMPMLRGIKATPDINMRMAMYVRVSFEQKTIALPISYREYLSEADEGGEKKKLTEDEEKKIAAVHIESDATQIELGNIVPRKISNGYSYDTGRPNQKKDRYSSLAMACLFISEIEDDLKRKYQLRKNGGAVIGVVYDFAASKY